MIKRFIARLFSVRCLKTVIFAAVCLGTLVAAFYIIENWRGEKAWAATKAALKAQGRPMTFAEVLPKPPPDEKNFVMSPVLVKWCGFGQFPPPQPVSFDFKLKSSDGQAIDESELWHMIYICWRRSEPRPDWPRLAALLTSEEQAATAATPEDAARLVLQTLSGYEQDFAALAEDARSRPLAYLPFDWKNYWKTYDDRPISNWLALSRVLQLRALAQIALHDAEGALDSLEIVFRLAESCRADPQPLAMFVLAAGIDASSFFTPLWYGWNERLWNDSQWRRLAEMASVKQPTAGLNRAVVTDLVFALELIEDMVAREPSPRVPAQFSSSFFPRGWLRQNQIAFAAMSDRRQRRLDLPVFQRPPAEDDMMAGDSPAWHDWRPYSALARLWDRGLSGVERAVDDYEGHWAVVRAAIALERYRLKTGRFPATLAELPAAEFGISLTDPFTGQPLHYRLNDGQPVVWSQGRGPALPPEAWPDPEGDHIVWGLVPPLK